MIRADRFLVRFAFIISIVAAALAWHHPLGLYLSGVTAGTCLGIDIMAGAVLRGVRKRDSVVRTRVYGG